MWILLCGVSNEFVILYSVRGTSSREESPVYGTASNYFVFRTDMFIYICSHIMVTLTLTHFNLC